MPAHGCGRRTSGGAPSPVPRRRVHVVSSKSTPRLKHRDIRAPIVVVVGGHRNVAQLAERDAQVLTGGGAVALTAKQDGELSEASGVGGRDPDTDVPASVAIEIERIARLTIVTLTKAWSVTGWHIPPWRGGTRRAERTCGAHSKYSRNSSFADFRFSRLQ